MICPHGQDLDLEFNPPCFLCRIEELEVENAILRAKLLESNSRLAAERQQIAKDFALILEWKQKGEQLCEKQNSSVLFALGSWWADRPWKIR